MAHAGVDAMELELQRYRLGDTLEGEVTVEHIVITVGTYRGGDERGGRELLGVEEVGGLEVGVALLVAGVDRVDVDGGGDRRGAVLGDGDGTFETVERAADLAHHQMADREVDRGMHRVQRPGAGGQIGGDCCGHDVSLHGGAGLPGTLTSCKRTVVRFHSAMVPHFASAPECPISTTPTVDDTPTTTARIATPTASPRPGRSARDSRTC